MPFHGKLLNLKPNILFVGYQGDNQTMAKVIIYDEPDKSRAFKPNLTASMVGYLLGRDENDFIHYDQFTDTILSKFNNVTPRDIDSILTTLNNDLQVLDIKDETTQLRRTDDPDPSEVFKGSKIEWVSPIITPDEKKLKVKGKHAYSKGYYFITFWR